jgi:hypothetical protein
VNELTALAEDFSKKAGKALEKGDVASAKMWIEAANMTLARARNMPEPVSEKHIVYDRPYYWPPHKYTWGTTDNTFQINSVTTTTAGTLTNADGGVSWYQLTNNGVELSA